MKGISMFSPRPQYNGHNRQMDPRTQEPRMQKWAFAHRLGFKLALVISLVLLTVFVGKAAYDAVTSYSDELEESTLKVTTENQLVAAEINSVFATVYQTCLGGSRVCAE